MKKRFVAMMLMVAMTIALLAGCSWPSSSGGSGGSESGSTGQVTYMNFKPEVSQIWTSIAQEYESETGVKVNVTTAASGQYETTLKSQIDGSQAPTLFQINGPVGLASWKDYCLDMSDTDVYKDLTDQNMAVLGTDGKPYGIPFTIECYGIIYNDAIMNKYFALDGAVVTSMDDIDNFDTLKQVVEDMQSKASDLGITGVFASTSLKPGEDWRWNTHLLNLPIYYEFKDASVQDEATIEFTYSDNFQGIFDLYTDNSVSAKGVLGSIDVNTSMAEFAMGQCAMVQNGNWAWSQISDTQGNTVQSSDIKFLPIYFGVDDSTQGLCVGTENFWAINSKASDEDIQATKDFLTWLITNEKGQDFMYKSTDDGGLGNAPPFNTFTTDQRSDDPLAQEMYRWMDMSDKSSVTWAFTAFPSQQFKNDVGQDLLSYVNGNMTWDQVKDDVIAKWASEKTAAASATE